MLKGPVYICGPMSHYPGYNRANFVQAKKYLQEYFHESAILSPWDNGLPNPGESPYEAWIRFMRMDVIMVAKSNLLVTLSDWECSRGARIEVDLAISLHIPALPLDVALDALRNQREVRDAAALSGDKL